MWLHRLQADLVRGKEYDAAAVKRDFLSFTTSWTHRSEEDFSLQPSGNPVAISRDLFKKYGEDSDEMLSSIAVDPPLQRHDERSVRSNQVASDDQVLHAAIAR